MIRVFVTGLAVVVVTAAARADVYTVGPGGTHATIQSAIDTAVASGGRHEVHVATGRWRERIRLDVDEGHSVRLSGGWVDGFRRQIAPDPDRPGEASSNSVLDGEGGGSVVFIRTGGFVSVQGFTITGGGGTVNGGGLQVFVFGFGAVEVHGNVIWENRLSMPDGTSGGGMSARAIDSAHLSLRQNHFLRNAAEATGEGAVVGGGADVFARDEAFVEVHDNRFIGNDVRAVGEAVDAGLSLEIQGNAQGHADDNLVRDNRALSKTSQAVTALRLAAEALGLPGRPRLVARRNQVVGNLIESPRGQQVELHASAGGTLELTDSVVAGGSGGGIVADTRDDGVMYLVNLTVADHPDYGIRVPRVGVHLTNSILFGNGDDLLGDALQSHNLIGVDPLFVAAGNYHLGPGSPAIDAGLNSATGLGPTDIDRESRTQGGRVDIGADETADDGVPEPICAVLEPEIVIPHAFPICRCVSDPGLRSARCGALTPDLFLVFRVPLRWKAGEEIHPTWTIHPWTPVAGPYAMSAQARIDGKWVPQTWLGPTVKTLAEGKLVVEPFTFELPAEGRTSVRTTVKYLRPGQKGFSTVAVQVSMPDPSEPPASK